MSEPGRGGGRARRRSLAKALGMDGDRRAHLGGSGAACHEQQSNVFSAGLMLLGCGQSTDGSSQPNPWSEKEAEMKWSIAPTVVAFLLAGMLTAAAKSTKRVATDNTKGDTYALSADVGIPRLPSVFRNCEHPAAWFCTDGPPAAFGESRRVRIRHRSWVW
jgi:hypothetical protein